VDFKEFRSAKVWLKIDWRSEDDPEAPAIEIRVAYCPASLGEQDAEFIALFEKVRVAEFSEGSSLAAAPVETEAQRRSRERAALRADATPSGKAEQGPTLMDYLTRLVVDWDLTWGGEPWPPCAESFGMLELGLRGEIVGAILRDYIQRPNRMSSLSRSLAAMTGTGLTTPSSLPRPSSTDQASSPGTSSDAPNGVAAPYLALLASRRDREAITRAREEQRRNEEVFAAARGRRAGAGGR
jgi:hypothetical protein